VSNSDITLVVYKVEQLLLEITFPIIQKTFEMDS
jgi:hypothetical protein